jgi:hypothetical protein
MRPLGAVLPVVEDKPRLLHVCASPLIARHVSVVRLNKFALSAHALSVLAHRFPKLRELECRFEGSWSPLVFPAQLRKLSLQFNMPDGSELPSFSEEMHCELDEAIVAIAALPLLEELSITADMARTCCLTPLATAPSLRLLSLNVQQDVLQSPGAIVALRSMPHLRSLTFDPHAQDFVRMLAVPHTMQLETLSVWGSLPNAVQRWLDCPV